MKCSSLRAVNLLKYNVAVAAFVLLLTQATIVSCGSKPVVSRIEGKEIPITSSLQSSVEFENAIRPYRENIDRELSTVLAYSPRTLDKNQGQWQTAIGNLMADASIEMSNPVFRSRTNKDIDLCLLNFGGIRSIIPQGNVTTRTAFEIMPFENSLIVMEMPGTAIAQMVDYIISEKKAHPVSGLTFTISADNQAKNIAINGKPLEASRNYYVVTSDYLANGGDNMVFFKDAVSTTSVDYKLRNVLIDYFKKVDTLPIPEDVRIRKEAK